MKWAHPSRDFRQRPPTVFTAAFCFAAALAALLVPASSAAADATPGQVWAWGKNNYGQLGDDTIDNRHTPIRADQLTDITVLAAGRYHTLARAADGTVQAWGYNWVGQLGDGTTTERHRPVQVSGLTGCVALAAGDYHSLAAISDGTVRAWGRNFFGQLGDGTTIDRHLPVPVGSLTGVIALAGGRFHTVALKSDGTVWTWGRNLNGQLGDGTTTDQHRPIRVGGLEGVVSVAAGYSHTAVAKDDGTVWTWGRNNYGQLGDGTMVERHWPIQVGGLDDVVSVAAGYYHTLAIQDGGTLSVWGRNIEGQLGDGSTTDRHWPVAMNSPADIVAAAAGAVHTLLLTGDGQAWACGYNGEGQLGDHSSTSRSRPVRVYGVNALGYLPGVQTVACGGYHSLAVVDFQATLSVDNLPPEGGDVAVDPEGGEYDYGTWVTIEASAGPGWLLEGWSGLPSGFGSGDGSDCGSGLCTGVGAVISFNIVGDVHLEAHFQRHMVLLEFLPHPGGDITGHPEGQYQASTTVSLHAEPAQQYRFVRWMVNGQEAGQEADLSLLMDGDKTVEAVFVYQCALTVINGSGSGLYDEGSEVEIVADWPAEHFDQWIGDVATVVDLYSPTTIIVVDGHYTVTAQPTAQLTVAVRTEDDLDWVYQNTPACLANNGQKIRLEVEVLDYAGNDSVDVAVAKVAGSGPGEVTIQDDPQDDPLVRYIFGSLRTDGLRETGALALQVTVTGNVWGAVTVELPLVVRCLGDVDGNGGPEPPDSSFLAMVLNGKPPPAIHEKAFDLDANGGAEPGDMQILINILNGLPVS